MAPTYTSDSANTMLSAEDKHKLRKPVGKKMEFHKQDPNTKLEKADILEMTVGFLTQKLQPQSPVPQRAHSEGYSQCWRETLHFLSSSSMKDMMLQNLQRAGQDVCPSSPLSSQHQHHSQGPVKQATSGHKTVWRPW
uniref:BHLH domain-containing protein n=1 Tax=Oncorhynchus mykiss TaxID=8022 RepID=A0A8C7PZL9_ONCMY